MTGAGLLRVCDAMCVAMCGRCDATRETLRGALTWAAVGIVRTTTVRHRPVPRLRGFKCPVRVNSEQATRCCLSNLHCNESQFTAPWLTQSTGALC